ncbi:transmembrane protein, putative [Medicago truncatula]|uniref:Transmembrane protein, putative n=1 Tax=Medicago truncatula TaxID=3880 RepID=G7IS87_MEDTR|nr:transmembrane protein, putative [Medicago truncatula]
MWWYNFVFCAIIILLLLSLFILEFRTKIESLNPEVSGSIPSGVNFGGVHTELALALNGPPRKWAVGLVPSD